MRGTLVVISLVFLGLVAAACGGGAPAHGGAASPAPSNAPAPPNAPTSSPTACTGG